MEQYDTPQFEDTQEQLNSNLAKIVSKIENPITSNDIFQDWQVDSKNEEKFLK